MIDREIVKAGLLLCVQEVTTNLNLHCVKYRRHLRDDNFIDRIIVHATKRRKKIHKVVNYMSTIASYDLETFRCHFRLTRYSFEVVLQLLAPVFVSASRNVNGGHPSLTIEKSLLMTLWILANEESFRSVSDRFDVAKGTCYKHFEFTIGAIISTCRTYIRFPKSHVEMQEVIVNFNRLRGPFPNIIGAVDGMHLPILAPTYDAASFYNRKGYHSIILQGVCDARAVFIDVFIGWPGSSHDSRVWKSSPLGTALKNHTLQIPLDFHIVGDSAYPVEPYLMTPYRDNGHLTQKQRNFNYLLSSKRVVIEHAFGILKSKFRRLKYLPLAKTDIAKDIAMSCCILHNICIIEDKDEISSDHENIDGVDHENELIENCNAFAAAKRNNLADLLWTV